jgi:type I site-specific restriction endonuclease
MTVYEYAHRPKAYYKGKVRDKYSDAVHLFFEYRGREYMITDEHNGHSEPMHRKHQYEQARIDQLIEAEQHEAKEWQYEGSADEAISWFLDQLNQG